MNPLFVVLIDGKTFNVFIEETFSEKDDGRSGILFRLRETGKKFFLPFERFSITNL